jgi:shikimate dehydrogenase
MTESTPDQYAVIGNPIKHSKSPEIHTRFAKQTGENLTYTTLFSPLEEFQQTVSIFRKQGGKGLNVTVPFKQEAWELADELSDYAQRAGAVNTLVFRDDGSVYGANTDGIGLLTDLKQNHQINPAGKHILILGAGGAVRGVLQPIIEEHPASIFIANRTVARAENLAHIFSDLMPLQAGGFDDIPRNQHYDIIINGTAASLDGDIPPVPEHCISNTECSYDMMYSSKPTVFVKWGRAHGIQKSVDGFGMLVEQAAEAFLIWRGVRPDTAGLPHP